jgi:hypothetical protein
MKKITLLFTPLLLILGLNAQEVHSGSTARQYSKPGAPIDMKYTSDKVEVNEVSDVNISLSTTARTGTLSVLISIDSNLSSAIELDNNLSYEIQTNKQTFPIHLKVKSKQEGLYYIRLLTKIDQGYGIKLRSFAVPIYVGKDAGIKSKEIGSQMKALSSGENISVSKALETIEVLK